MNRSNWNPRKRIKFFYFVPLVSRQIAFFVLRKKQPHMPFSIQLVSQGPLWNGKQPHADHNGAILHAFNASTTLARKDEKASKPFVCSDFDSDGDVIACCDSKGHLFIFKLSENV